MEYYGYNSEIEDLSMEEEDEPRRGGNPRKKTKNTNNHGDDFKFKSKNLGAERRRRAKLNDGLLQLRTLVPIITNMTKANIIKDAITYIEELKKEVEELSDDLLEFEDCHDHHDKKEEIKPIRDHENNGTQEMKNWGIEPEVKVIFIGDNKLWVKVVFANKLGGLTKLIEAINKAGFDLNDTNLTTTKGAAILTSCLEGRCDGSVELEEIKELLLHIINI